MGGGMQRRAVEARRDTRKCKERLRFRGECEPMRVAVQVDRLDPEGGTPHPQPPAARIPQRESVHAVQPMDELVVPLGVAMYDDLAVGSGLEPMAGGLELASQLAKIVDFTVAHEPHRPLRVLQWSISR